MAVCFDRPDKEIMTNQSFSSFGLNPRLLKAVDNLGFETPTEIQQLAIKPIMDGRDILASAATGSGKTAAFLLPVLHQLINLPRKTTRVLVLTPTRELAAQIVDHLRELAANTDIKGAAVFGGVGMQPQTRAFEKGVDVIVATPGRLLDHFQYPHAKLSGLEYLILDEADRMLDMGFLPDIKRIFRHIPKGLQTLLFSATLPQPIVELASGMLKNPVAINVERKAGAAKGITHSAFPVPYELKSLLLLELLKRPEASSVLAFTRTKHRANRLTEFLEKRGVSCSRIHGGRSQAQRTAALKGFKAGRFNVLIATDVAARGIDVKAISLVVNFDVPEMPDDYIHRVGRTARASATGNAYTLVSPQEERDFRRIENELGHYINRQKIEGFDYKKKSSERFEVPIAERIAAIRARKAEERERSKAKARARDARRPTREIKPAAKEKAGKVRTRDIEKSNSTARSQDRKHVRNASSNRKYKGGRSPVAGEFRPRRSKQHQSHARV